MFNIHQIAFVLVEVIFRLLVFRREHNTPNCVIVFFEVAV